MPRDLTRAQLALLLSIDEATWPRGTSGMGLTVAESADRTRLARDGLVWCRRMSGGGVRGGGFRWSTTAAGKLRAERARAEEAERRAAAP